MIIVIPNNCKENERLSNMNIIEKEVKQFWRHLCHPSSYCLMSVTTYDIEIMLDNSMFKHIEITLIKHDGKQFWLHLCHPSSYYLMTVTTYDIEIMLDNSMFKYIQITLIKHDGKQFWRHLCHPSFYCLMTVTTYDIEIMLDNSMLKHIEITLITHRTATKQTGVKRKTKRTSFEREICSGLHNTELKTWILNRNNAKQINTRE